MQRCGSNLISVFLVLFQVRPASCGKLQDTDLQAQLILAVSVLAIGVSDGEELKRVEKTENQHLLSTYV